LNKHHTADNNDADSEPRPSGYNHITKTANADLLQIPAKQFANSPLAPQQSFVNSHQTAAGAKALIRSAL